ncbi:hypothetical protein AQUCO_00500244v1 [Aquilegia coerulea]|uniref:F-box domain-containing protein n=1 Tax=Aquilegia coerulea TaxID=218851 RepID=A0A2G5ER23_AQUCA|nr:hypothetical protein AQUCO_00500244v1 [Aquilegia coerulea]
MKRQCLSPLHNLDKISSLHDSIRLHILSFLPMEDAIRTTILSKSWRNVCSSLPILEFSEWAYEQKKCKKKDMDAFKDIIDHTLMLHDESNIISFRLILSRAPISTPHINSWVSFALQHNVQHLTLYSVYRPIEQLPRSLFVCSSLRVLDLSNVPLKLPNSIQFPLLKSLMLSWVEFLADNLVSKLLSCCCCPVLESLVIVRCYQYHANTHTISFSNLKYLKLFKNEVVSRLKIILSIPNLQKFIYSGQEPPSLTYQTLASISDAKFVLTSLPTNSNETGSDYFNNCASKILKGLRNVEKLTLGEFYIENLTRDRDLSTCLATSCYTLKTLELYMYATKNQVQAVTLLLRSYPNLETLNVFFSEEDCTSLNMLNMEEYWQLKVVSMRDPLKHLKTVEIDLFKGSKNELLLLRSLLMSASMLEKMNVKLSRYSRGNVENRTKLSEKLLTFTKVSPHTTICIVR